MSTDTSRSRQSFYQSSSSQDSAGDLSYATDDHPPPLPNAPSLHLNIHKPKKSTDTLSSSFTNSNGRIPSPIPRSRSPHDFPPAQSKSQPQPPSRPLQSRTMSRDAVSQVGKTAGQSGPTAYHPPRTPPRRTSQTFRVVNEDALSQSPPPAYHLGGGLPSIDILEKPPLSSSQSQHQQETPRPLLQKAPSTRREQADREPRASVISTSTVTPGSGYASQPADQRNTSGVTEASSLGAGEAEEEDDGPVSLPPLELSMSSLSMSPAVPSKKKKRYSLAPPRLSLGQDAFADIGSWGDSLFHSLSATPTTSADTTLDASTSTSSRSVDKSSAPVLDGIGVEKRNPETSLSASVSGSNFTSKLLAVKEKEKEKDEKKESSDTHGLTSQSSSLISSPLVTSQSLTPQKTHQRSQPSSSQPQSQSQSPSQPGPTPPPKTAPIIPPPILSTSTSSSSTASTSSSGSQPMTRMLPSTTKAVDRFVPSPSPSPARGRSGTGPDPPKPEDPSLSKTSSANPLPKPQPQLPRERSNSRASTVHRPLPPQKPLPTRSLMSPIPLPNPPSHVELKSKISTVSLKTAAKRDREKEKEKEAEKFGKVESVGKEQEVVKEEQKVKAKVKVKGEGGEDRWPMTAKERIELMASINHDNDGLDFGGRKEQDTSASPDINHANPVSMDPRDSYDVRDTHLSVDSIKFDPNRLSSASAGSRPGSTRSSSGGGLKLFIGAGSDYHNDNRDSNVSTSTITNATIVSGPVEVATRARADLVTSPVTLGGGSPFVEVLSGAGSKETTPKQTTPSVSNVDVVIDEGRSRVGFGGRSPSPGSSTHSHSSSSATTLSSTGLSSLGSANKTAGFIQPVIKQHSGWEGEEEGVRRVIASGSPSPLASPYKSKFDDESDEEEDDEDDVGIEVGDEEEDLVLMRVSPPPPESRKGSIAGLVDEVNGYRRPSLVIPPLSSYSLKPSESLTTAASVSQMLRPLNGAPNSAGSGGSSPGQRYPGWVSNVLSQVDLEIFVDEKVEPRDFFEGLTEVAEGESGFVYQAKVVRVVPGSRLTKRELQSGGVVAIKAVPILPSGSSKLEDLRREVEVMKRVLEDYKSAASSFSSASGYPAGVAHVLIMEAMYVDLQEDALWIRMELMERSLADVVALVEGGHLERIDEKVVARFASDVSRTPLVLLFSASVGD